MTTSYDLLAFSNVHNSNKENIKNVFSEFPPKKQKNKKKNEDDFLGGFIIYVTPTNFVNLMCGRCTDYLKNFPVSFKVFGTNNITIFFLSRLLIARHENCCEFGTQWWIKFYLFSSSLILSNNTYQTWIYIMISSGSINFL